VPAFYELLKLTRAVLEKDGIDQRGHSWLYDRREIMVHLPNTKWLSLPQHSQINWICNIIWTMLCNVL